MTLTLDERLSLESFECVGCTVVPGVGNTQVLTVPFLAAQDQVLVELAMLFDNSQNDERDVLLDGTLVFGGATLTATTAVELSAQPAQTEDEAEQLQDEAEADTGSVSGESKLPTLIRTGGASR